LAATFMAVHNGSGCIIRLVTCHLSHRAAQFPLATKMQSKWLNTGWNAGVRLPAGRGFPSFPYSDWLLSKGFSVVFLLGWSSSLISL